MERDLTTGSVLSAILRFSPPFFLSYFLQTLYGMADLYIIGKFDGVVETTAVSIGSQVMHLFTVMIVGLAMGATIKIGLEVGGKNKEEMAYAIGNTISVFMILAVVLAAGLVFLISPIVSVMSTPVEAVEGTKMYLLICFIGIPAVIAYNVISSIFRGLGDSKSPMYFIAIACVLNIALDYLFIGGCHMGPAGAALGTTVAQAFSVVLAVIVVLRRKSDVKLKKKHFVPTKRIIEAILGVGIPIAIQDGFIQVSFIVITVIVNMRGLNDAAAVGIVEKMISFLFLVPSSMLATVSALGAQNIGAGKTDRVGKTLRYCLTICIVYGMIMVVIMQFNAEFVVRLFNKKDIVVRLGAGYLRGYIFDSIFAGIHFCFSGYFCAYEKSIYSFIHNVVSIICARIPLAYLASVSFPTTLFPMGLATVTGSMVSVMVCLILYRLLRKQREKNYNKEVCFYENK